MVEENSAKPVDSVVKKQTKQVKQFKPFKKVMKRFENKDKKAKNDAKPKITKKEIEDLIVKLYNDGKTQSEIGLILKQEYHILSVKKEINMTILEVLKKHKLNPSLPEDLKFLLKKAVALIKHRNKNNHDMTAKRGIQLTVSKIRRLSKYYKKKGILPKDWKYTEEKAALLVK